MATNGQGIEPALLDDIINRLLEFRNARTVRQVQLSENEIRALCTASREIFLSQPNLLELEAPIKICGIAILVTSVQFLQYEDEFCELVLFLCMPGCARYPFPNYV